MHDASPTVVARVLPGWGEKLERLAAPITARSIREMKAFSFPPPGVVGLRIASLSLERGFEGLDYVESSKAL